MSSVVGLRVSAHVMTLDHGLFCLYPTDDSPSPDLINGLPNVCTTPSPGAASESIKISTFRPDGWLDGSAALVQVSAPRASIVVTVYQNDLEAVAAPRIRVLRLQNGATVAPMPLPVARGQDTGVREVVAHIQTAGDITGKVGDWIGTRGSKQWIEGFSIAPEQIADEELEYQVRLGRDWCSPWVNGGVFCGSRGMGLPLLGFNVRIIGDSAARFACSYSATFVDGSTSGPVKGGTMCEAPTRAQLESFRLLIDERLT